MDIGEADVLPESGSDLEIKQEEKEMKGKKTKFGIGVLASVFAVAFAHAAIVPTNNTFTGSNSIDGWYNFTVPGKADGTLAEILYLNGAGSRYDWTDNDDSVSQSPLSTGDSLPAGGTITGDGQLADGALLVNSVDSTTGNEYIALNLGGTMEEGETITFSFNAFNHVEYYSYMQAQLWDITASNELEVCPWVRPLSVSDPAYTPLDGSVSYTVTPAEEGHQLAIVFREWHNSTSRQGYIDNIDVVVIPPQATLGITPLTNTFTGAASLSGWYNFLMPSAADGTEAQIVYLNGAGPRYDWADNDDLAVQAALTNGAALPPGGIATGDGVVADGGLVINSIDTTRGNEYIAYTLGGTMAEGERVTFGFNQFNHVDYYNEIQAQLWDITASNELAVSDWLSAKAVSDPAYAPTNGVVSYVATVAEEGHKLAIVFREWHNSTARQGYIDNLWVTSDLLTPVLLYNDWALGEGLTESNNAYGQNPDGDGLDNLAEYGLGGQPTNPANQGIASTYGTMEEGGTSWMTYVYARRSDYDLRGLDYHLETTPDLIYSAWTNDNYEVAGIGEPGGGFDYVTNRVSTDVENEQFLRVGIEVAP